MSGLNTIVAPAKFDGSVKTEYPFRWRVSASVRVGSADFFFYANLYE